MNISKDEAVSLLRKLAEESTEVWSVVWGKWGAAAFSGYITEASEDQLEMAQGRLKSAFRIGDAIRFQWGDSREVPYLKSEPGEVAALMFIAFEDGTQIAIGEVLPINTAE